MDEEEDKKPKQFGDLMSIEDPSGAGRKSYRGPTLEERLLLYPGQALESVKDVWTRPSDDPYESGITSLLGKIPESAWAVLDPLIEQTGKDVTQAYSGITEKDQGKKLATVTALTGMVMGMKPPKKGDKRRTKFTNKEIDDFAKGVGPDPARDMGFTDDSFEDMNRSITKALEGLEIDNLPRLTYPGNPVAIEDANNVTNKWRNMYEDWHSWGIQDSEQVTRGISPTNRLYTVPTGKFDEDGKALFKTVDSRKAFDEALAKTEFDMRRDMGKYFTYEPVRGALPQAEMTQAEKDLENIKLAEIQREKDLLSGEIPKYDGRWHHPVLGRNTFSKDGTQLIKGPDEKRVLGVEAGKFLDRSEEVEIPEAILMSDNAWGKFNKWHIDTYDRPFVRPYVNDQGILYRMSSPEEVKAFALHAGDGTQKYLLEIGLGKSAIDPTSEAFKNRMFSALTEVEGQLYSRTETQRKSEVNLSEVWAKKAGQEVGVKEATQKRFPLLSDRLTSNDERAQRQVGYMLVEELVDNDGYNAMLKELEGMYGVLGKDNLKEYKGIMDDLLDKELFKLLGAWWDEQLVRPWRSRGTPFGGTPDRGVGGYWGPGENPWVNRGR